MLYIIVCRCLSLHCQPVLPELWLHVYISIYASLAHRVAVLRSVCVHVFLCLGEGLVSGADNSIELCSVCVCVGEGFDHSWRDTQQPSLQISLSSDYWHTCTCVRSHVPFWPFLCVMCVCVCVCVCGDCSGCGCDVSVVLCTAWVYRYIHVIMLCKCVILQYTLPVCNHC